ncbi:MAG: VWA domain-containing protein [Candidatus Woesearchaeota archaeon]
MKKVMSPDEKVKLENFSPIQELSGKLSKSDDDKLLNSVMENDKDTIEEGRAIKSALNQGLSSFSPNLMFEQMVENYQLAKSIYGESIIRWMSGYNPNYVKKNIHIPEFQREIKKEMQKRFEDLKEKEYVDKDGQILDKGINVASLVLYTEELDNMIPLGIFGEKIHKKSFIYGGKEEIKNFKNSDRYRDIAIKKSIKLALRRGKDYLGINDLKVFERQSKGSIHIIYALDASGSMKGKKIDLSKKAGVALAYKAIQGKDKVGLIVFGTDIHTAIPPTDDFLMILREITKTKAAKQTDIAKTIEKSVEMFQDKNVTRHLVIISDALPTKGDTPEKDTLKACSIARNSNITISLIGINLDEKGVELGKKIAEIGNGNLFVVKDLEDLDKIILQDYYDLG